MLPKGLLSPISRIFSVVKSRVGTPFLGTKAHVFSIRQYTRAVVFPKKKAKRCTQKEVHNIFGNLVVEKGFV